MSRITDVRMIRAPSSWYVVVLAPAEIRQQLITLTGAPVCPLPNSAEMSELDALYHASDLFPLATIVSIPS